MEEGSSVTLPCLSNNDDYFERCWYNGWFNTWKSPKESDILYQQDKDKDVVIGTGSLDMSINKGNFSLSIDPAKLKDNGTYTCYVYTDITWPSSNKKTWDHIELQMYSKYGDLH